MQYNGNGTHFLAIRTSMRETKSYELYHYRPVDAEKCEFIKTVMLDLIKSYNFIFLLDKSIIKHKNY